MRILLISGIFPPDIGGPATFADMLSHELVKSGHLITVVSLADRRKMVQKNDLLKIISFTRKEAIISRFIRVTINIRKLAKKSDLVICTGLHEETGIALLGLNLCKIARVVGDPIWERVTNKNQSKISIEEFNFQKKHMNLKIVIQRKLLNFALNRFNLIITPGKHLRKIIQVWNIKSPIKYLPNAINSEFFPDTRNQTKRKTLLVNSRLVKWKRIDLAIKLAKMLNYQIIIAGEGPERAKLVETAKASNIRFSFVGTVDKPGLLKLLNKCSLFVQMSEYEGMSFSLLEAMKSGLLVIVSNISPNREVVTHKKNGFVFQTNRFDLSTKELKTLLMNSKSVNRITSNAIKSIEIKHNLKRQISFLINYQKNFVKDLA